MLRLPMISSHSRLDQVSPSSPVTPSGLLARKAHHASFSRSGTSLKIYLFCSSRSALWTFQELDSSRFHR